MAKNIYNHFTFGKNRLVKPTVCIFLIWLLLDALLCSNVLLRLMLIHCLIASISAKTKINDECWQNVLVYCPKYMLFLHYKQLVLDLVIV